MGKRKLTKEQVDLIRKLKEQGVTERDLARLCNVHYSAINHIVHFRNWK